MTARALAYTETADQLAAVDFKAAYRDGPSAIANILRQVATGRIVIADARPGPEMKSLRGLLESGLPDSLLNRRGVAISQAYAVVLWLGTDEGQALAREAAPDDNSSTNSNDAGAVAMNGAPTTPQKEN